LLFAVAALRRVNDEGLAVSHLNNGRKMMKLKQAFPVVVLALACLASVSSAQAQAIATAPTVKATVITPMTPVLSAAPAYNHYAGIQGPQGPFNAEVPAQPSHKGTIGVINFAYQQVAPPPTGALAGRKPLTPITITKAVGAASPQIRKACATGEVLPVVTLEFLRPNSKGQEVLVETMVLRNAIITSDKLLTSALAGANQTAPTVLEEVTFVYQQMVVTTPPSSTTKQDSWAAPQ
jgi:type VI secretion system Hcp family effector